MLHFVDEEFDEVTICRDGDHKGSGGHGWRSRDHGGDVALCQVGAKPVRSRRGRRWKRLNAAWPARARHRLKAALRSGCPREFRSTQASEDEFYDRAMQGPQCRPVKAFYQYLKSVQEGIARPDPWSLIA